MIRPVVAWFLFIAGLCFMGLDVSRWNITGLFLTGVVLLAVWLWLIGGFRRSFWIEGNR